MSCEAWSGRIIDRLADELGEEDAIALEQHLADCPGCAAEETAVSRVLAAAGSPMEWVPGNRMEERLLDELGRLRPIQVAASGTFLGRRIPRPMKGSRSVPAFAAATLAFLALAGGFWAGSVERSFREMVDPTAGPHDAEISPKETVRPLDGDGDGGGGGDGDVALARVQGWITSVRGFSGTPADGVYICRAFFPDSL